MPIKHNMLTQVLARDILCDQLKTIVNKHCIVIYNFFLKIPNITLRAWYFYLTISPFSVKKIIRKHYTTIKHD
jgi:hypothetical protein